MIYPDFLSAMIFLLSFLISKKESRSVGERNETGACVLELFNCVIEMNFNIMQFAL